MTAAPASLLDQTGRELDRKFVVLPGGQRLAYAEAGRGRPVVLVHGVLTTLEDMVLALGDQLVPNHRVIAFDRPGCGRSGNGPEAGAGVWLPARQLLAALEALAVEQPIIIGHSLGGSISIAMAAEAPSKVNGVVAVAPLVVPEPRLEQALFGLRGLPPAGWSLAQAGEATIDRMMLPLLWRAMFLPQAMPAGVRETFPFALAGRASATVRTGEDSLATMAGLARTLNRAGRCPVPVRIIGGDRDLVVRNGLHGRMLAALMPNGEYIDAPGLGHMAHHFASKRIVDLVSAFPESA